jgi:hypothetical protein
VIELPDVLELADVPPERLPAVVLHLTALLAGAAVRMLAVELELPRTTMEPDHEITQEQAAQLRPALGLKLIRFLTRTGRVPSVLHGRQRLVLLGDLDAYVARCRVHGVALGTILDVSSPRDRRRGAQDP